MSDRFGIRSQRSVPVPPTTCASPIIAIMMPPVMTPMMLAPIVVVVMPSPMVLAPFIMVEPRMIDITWTVPRLRVVGVLAWLPVSEAIIPRSVAIPTYFAPTLHRENNEHKHQNRQHHEDLPLHCLLPLLL